jgi:hypothetical protein
MNFNDMDDFSEQPSRLTYDGKRMRSKPMNRKTTDFNSGAVAYVKVWNRVVLVEMITFCVFISRSDNTFATKVTGPPCLPLKLLKKEYGDFYILCILSSHSQFMCPLAFASNPSSSITSKFIHTSTNKQRCPVNCVVVCFYVN